MLKAKAQWQWLKGKIIVAKAYRQRPKGLSPGGAGQPAVPGVVGCPHEVPVPASTVHVHRLAGQGHRLGCVERLPVVDPHVDGAQVAGEPEHDDHPHQRPGEEDQVGQAARPGTEGRL